MCQWKTGLQKEYLIDMEDVMVVTRDDKFMKELGETLISDNMLSEADGIGCQPALARRLTFNTAILLSTEECRICMANVKPGLGQGVQILETSAPPPFPGTRLRGRSRYVLTKAQNLT